MLGIDNGGTVAKAGLFDVQGRELATAGRKTPMSSPAPGHTERDAEVLWQATAEAVREVIERAGVAPGQIACVATAGHGNGLYLVDGDGQPVRPGIVSTDTRAAEYVARWNAEGVAGAVRPKTMQSLWPGQPNALLAWLQDNEPESIQRAAWALMCKDFIRAKLTGEFYLEETDASATSLMDVGTGRYDDDLLAACGIAGLARLLPPVRRSDATCGQVTTQAAAQTGLRAGTPVAGGLFDADACGLAAGIVDERQLQIIAGTWSVNQYVSRTPVVDPDVFMTSRYCVPGYYLIMEASATSASNLEWFVNNILGPESAALHARGESILDVCNREVGAIDPADSDIVFLPFLFGANASPSAKACLLGMSSWHGRGHVLRAVYDGVVMSHRWHVERLLRFRNKPDAIRLAGGAARSRPWRQAFADAFQTPVEIPAGTELGALGSAIVAGVAAGCFDDYAAAVRAMVHVVGVCNPRPEQGPVYDAKFARYQEVLNNLTPLWSTQAR
ncbi:MAG: FGGY-family carbohydrate kinase [Thermoguttaceae bacterium]|nr:FGGY-family carbohydrate kinase [Thermoguttaceae bacterium]